MRTLLIAFLCLFALASFAQQPADPSSFYAAGVSYNNGASPAVAGTALYAKKVADTGTYAFTVVDAVVTQRKPFTVQTNFGAGIAQRILTVGNVKVFIPTSAGVSYAGGNTGWAWTTGGMASIPIGKGSFRLCPNVRIIKSNVGDQSYHPVGGILFGWGQ